MANTLNYTEQGGATTVIGGTLKVSGSIVNGSDAMLIANQAASTAATVADLKTDFNALLTKLKSAGLMVADA